ncbi:hypothetical protein LR948_07230 [Roseivivax sp. GX 12232]|uniref:hypothetical protein n=1 Tax=Roseivivax sp. GX 12232 TaxID=2900547 RepID=UPI001E540FC7|nr:hypothetical protein [Roseivivax sp. GX 12232]MCE0505139.1 hypothetical protein [Roseivivax sp. GX 12232]
MKLTRLAVLALAAGTFGLAGELSAQQRSTDVPMEFPPSSYEGRQYVDSRGCVYIRAGIDGATNWVPRVSRQRRHICGQTPTLGEGGTRTAAAAPGSEVERITLDSAPSAAAPRQAQAQAQARTTTTAPQPQAQRRATAPQPQQVKPAPQIVRQVPAPAAQPAPARTRVATEGGCRGASAISQQYIGNSQGLPVRCGPQTTSHVTVIRRGETPGPNANVYIRQGYDDSNLRLAPAATRSGPGPTIVPDQVYETLRAEAAVRVPEGYERAWDDDRLNPRRAFQTPEGYYATQQVWTNTVPRRLVATADRHRVRDPIIIIPR